MLAGGVGDTFAVMAARSCCYLKPADGSGSSWLLLLSTGTTFTLVTIRLCVGAAATE